MHSRFRSQRRTQTKFIVLLRRQRGGAQLSKHQTSALQSVHELIQLLYIYREAYKVQKRKALTRCRFICWTCILTVFRASLRSLPSSGAGADMLVARQLSWLAVTAACAHTYASLFEVVWSFRENFTIATSLWAATRFLPSSHLAICQSHLP